MEFYELIKYAILGLIQGFTEPIPISSSGHLVIVERLLGLHIEGLSFEVLVNFASLLAVLLIYRQDLIRMLANSFQFMKSKTPETKPDFMFLVYIVIGTVPAVISVLLFGDFIADQLKDIKVIGITLLLTGLALWLIRNLKGKKQDNDLRFKDALIVGLAQTLALIPGISRSGATIVASVGLGMKSETALRFSFMLYIPISIGAMVLSGKELLLDPDRARLLLPYTVAFVCSLLASYFALRWFMGIMARGRLLGFAIYCWIIGVAVLLFM